MKRFLRQDWARWLGAAALATLLAVSGDAYGQQRPAPPPPSRPAPVQPATAAPAAGPVAVELLCVLGTNRHERVDPGLKPIIQHLKFTRYTGFELIDTHANDLAVGDETTFSIEGGRKVKVKLIERDDTAAKVRVQMYNDEGKQLDTTISIHRNRSFMVAGPRLGEDVLILPLTVRY